MSASPKERIPFLFSPGNGDTFSAPDQPSFQSYMDTFEAAGFDATFVGQDWEATPETWRHTIVDLARQQTASEVVLGGFSFGALASAMAAQTLGELREGGEAVPTVSGLVLMSLSPFTKEMIARYEAEGSERLELAQEWPDYWPDFKRWSLPSLSMPVQLYRGELESEWVKAQVHNATEAFPNHELIIVDGANHNAHHPNYIAAIAENVGALAVAA